MGTGRSAPTAEAGLKGEARARSGSREWHTCVGPCTTGQHPRLQLKATSRVSLHSRHFSRAKPRARSLALGRIEARKRGRRQAPVAHVSGSAPQGPHRRSHQRESRYCPGARSLASGHHLVQRRGLGPMAAIDADFAFRHAPPPAFEGEAASVASACAFWGPLLFGRSALWQGLRRTHAARPFLRRRIGRGSGRARRLPAGLHRGSCGELCAAERKQTPVLCCGLAQLNAVRPAKAGAEPRVCVRPACACLRAGSGRVPATAPALRSCSSGRGRPAAHPCRPGT